MMNIQEYKDRVIDHFRRKVALNNVSEGDWKFLSEIFLHAAENGTEGMEEFDKRILTSTEFQELFM